MGKQILTDCRIYAGAADLSGVSNKVALPAEVEEKDVTVFTSNGWRERLGGLRKGDLNVAGFWEAAGAGSQDDQTWGGLGLTGPWTVCPGLPNVGALAHFMNALQSDYVFGDAVGEVAPYQANAGSTWPLVRGQVGNAPGTARTTTGTGTSVQLGAVPAGQSLYAAVHVLSVAGSATPTITARVESDDATGFPSATTRLTFAAATAVGGQILRVAGPITDDWYRFAWTISGTTPSFLFMGAFGIA